MASSVFLYVIIYIERENKDTLGGNNIMLSSKKQQAKRKEKIKCDMSRVKYCVNKLNDYMKTTNEQKININDLFGVFLAEFRYEIHTFDYYETEMKKGFFIRFYEGEEAQLVFLEDETGKQSVKFDDFKVYEI